jgi:hypothetical protein
MNDEEEETTDNLRKLASETEVPRGATVEVWGAQSDGRPIVVRAVRAARDERIILWIGADGHRVYLDPDAASDLSEFLAILAAADGA